MEPEPESPSPPLYEFQLENILAEESTDNFIYLIREELIDKVMTVIEKIDEQERIVTFIVDIACDALWRMLNIEFIHHPPIPNISNPEWTGDPLFEQSPRDFLASSTVPITVRTETEEQFRDSLPEFICECVIDKKIPCECLLTPTDRNRVQLEELERPLTPPIKQESFFLQPQTGEDGDGETFGDQAENFDAVLQSLPSLVESTSSEDSVNREVRCVLSEGFSKLRQTSLQIVLPKIDVSKPGRLSFESSIVELPDIRAGVTQEFHSDEEEKREKARKLKEAERNRKLNRAA